MKLTEDSLTPLYQQVMDDIRMSIAQGSYRPGHKIPSESELSELYSVSRITIRRAIEELAAEGMLTKKQGKGTYVNPPKLEKKLTQLGSMQSYTDLCERAGRVPGSRVLEQSRIPVGAAAAEALGIAKGSEVINIKRVRTVDGTPLSIETAQFPAREFAYLMGVDFNDVSLYQVMAERGVRQPDHLANVQLDITPATLEMASVLGIRVGEALFNEFGAVVDTDSRPLFAVRLLIVGSMYSFRF